MEPELKLIHKEYVIAVVDADDYYFDWEAVGTWPVDR
jgi:hypothetical protein